MAYSMDLRVRVIDALHHEKLSQNAAARRFGVAVGTVNAWVKKHKAGDLQPGKPGPTGPGKLTEEDLQHLERMVQERPGITSHEAAAKLDHKVSEGHVRRVWLSKGLSYKKR